MAPGITAARAREEPELTGEITEVPDVAAASVLLVLVAAGGSSQPSARPPGGPSHPAPRRPLDEVVAINRWDGPPF